MRHVAIVIVPAGARDTILQIPDILQSIFDFAIAPATREGLVTFARLSSVNRQLNAILLDDHYIARLLQHYAIQPSVGASSRDALRAVFIVFTRSRLLIERLEHPSPWFGITSNDVSDYAAALAAVVPATQGAGTHALVQTLVPRIRHEETAAPWQVRQTQLVAMHDIASQAMRLLPAIPPAIPPVGVPVPPPAPVLVQIEDWQTPWGLVRNVIFWSSGGPLPRRIYDQLVERTGAPYSLSPLTGTGSLEPVGRSRDFNEGIVPRIATAAAGATVEAANVAVRGTTAMVAALTSPVGLCMGIPFRRWVAGAQEHVGNAVTRPLAVAVAAPVGVLTAGLRTVNVVLIAVVYGLAAFLSWAGLR